MFEIAEVASLAQATASETEQLRRLPIPIVDGLVSSGIMRAFVAKSLGGPDAHPGDVMSAITRLSQADGATGWCAMIGATTSLASGFIAPDWASEIYGDTACVTGGFAAPMGRAKVSDGGLIVSGQWQWGSGSHHCTWLGGGSVIIDDSGNPKPRSDGLAAPFLFFEKGQVELLDTWHVSGLKGTGSTDYRVVEAFVPEGRWFQIGDQPIAPDITYRFPFYGALAIGVASVMLGLADRALAELTELAGRKRPSGSARTLAERPVVQSQIASAVGVKKAAQALMSKTVADVWEAATAGVVPVDMRFDLRLAATTCAKAAVDVVDACYHAGGGSSIYEISALQRVFRDVHVATQHAMVASRTFEVLGRNLLGLPVNNAQI